MATRDYLGIRLHEVLTSQSLHDSEASLETHAILTHLVVIANFCHVDEGISFVLRTD